MRAEIFAVALLFVVIAVFGVMAFVEWLIKCPHPCATVTPENDVTCHICGRQWNSKEER